MNYREQQQKEIATIKERTLKLNLSDADCERIAEKAGSVGMTVSELLENFIGDLVDGTYTNGSDERMHANEWFDRCGFGMFPEKTLLKELLDSGYNIDDFLTVYDEMKLYEENPEEYKKDLEENHVPIEDPMWFYEEYKDYTEEFINEYKGTLDMEKEVALCRKWYASYESLLETTDKSCLCKKYQEVLSAGADGNDFTLADFGRACEELKLPFFETKETINPFAEPHNTIKTETYNGYEEFRRSMPEWSARNYDHENDRATYYFTIKGILDGRFGVRASNSSSSYAWYFIVTDIGVLVQTQYYITD